MGVIKKVKRGYREKLIISGKYAEIEVTPVFVTKRGKKMNIEDKAILKSKEISKKQKEAIRKKNARAYAKRRKKEFTRIAHCNFTENDYVIHLTYANENRPGSIEEAEKDARNYIRRLNYRRKKKGLEDIKYMIVTEYGESEKGLKNIHHHMILNGGLTRDEVEEAWSKKGKRIGYVNASRLQFSPDTGLKDLCYYMLKNPIGKKKWKGSKNLKKPIIEINYHKWSGRKVKNMIRNGIDDKTEWERLYNNELDFKGAKHEHNEWLGDLLYAQFVKKE